MEETVIESDRVDRYLVEKSLPLGLWRFAAPFMLAYFLQALYGAVDVFIVGQFCDEAAIAAVSTGAQLLQALTGLILGLSAGGTALIAYNVGAKDHEGAAKAIGSSATLFALIAVVATPLIAFFTNEFVDVMQTPVEAVEYTRRYCFIIACGLPFIIGYNVIGAIYRGFGDSTTPTVFVAIACVLNMLGDYLLVAVGGYGPQGAAIATVAAQGLSLALALVYMRVKRFEVDFHRRHFRWDGKATGKILEVGAPLALQDALTGVSFLVIIAIVNAMGVIPAAGMGVAERVIGFLFLPPVAFSVAVVTATAQNIGARQIRRAFLSSMYGTLFAFLFGVFFWVVCQIFPLEMASIFTDVEAVAYNASLYLRTFSLDLLFVAFIFNMNGFFCGSGRAFFVLAHSAFAAIFARIPLSYLFSRGEEATLLEVGWAAPLASCVSVLLCAAYFIILWRKRTDVEAGSQ